MQSNKTQSSAVVVACAALATVVTVVTAARQRQTAAAAVVAGSTKTTTTTNKTTTTTEPSAVLEEKKKKTMVHWKKENNEVQKNGVDKPSNHQQVIWRDSQINHQYHHHQHHHHRQQQQHVIMAMIETQDSSESTESLEETDGSPTAIDPDAKVNLFFHDCNNNNSRHTKWNGKFHHDSLPNNKRFRRWEICFLVIVAFRMLSSTTLFCYLRNTKNEPWPTKKSTNETTKSLLDDADTTPQRMVAVTSKCRSNHHHHHHINRWTAVKMDPPDERPLETIPKDDPRMICWIVNYTRVEPNGGLYGMAMDHDSLMKLDQFLSHLYPIITIAILMMGVYGPSLVVNPPFEIPWTSRPAQLGPQQFLDPFLRRILPPFNNVPFSSVPVVNNVPKDDGVHGLYAVVTSALDPMETIAGRLRQPSLQTIRTQLESWWYRDSRVDVDMAVYGPYIGDNIGHPWDLWLSNQFLHELSIALLQSEWSIQGIPLFLKNTVMR